MLSGISMFQSSDISGSPQSFPATVNIEQLQASAGQLKTIIIQINCLSSLLFTWARLGDNLYFLDFSFELILTPKSLY